MKPMMDKLLRGRSKGCKDLQKQADKLEREKRRKDWINAQAKGNSNRTPGR